MRKPFTVVLLLLGLAQKNAKVVIITDACHSGALAGQGIGGRQATAAEMMKRYANEVRIMSCQPYELSQEKRALGGGRGVFSYYLIQGLKGRANQGPKDVVDLYELENFLQEKVRRETGKSQHPDIFGGLKKEALFFALGLEAQGTFHLIYSIDQYNQDVNKGCQVDGENISFTL